ncbi:inverse autotransporter beta domain-containing protein [Klebsiella aerogenes]|nr:inverse autotransporter beta domain-containing protein [Klebsiella aerogenes]ELY3087595.1 inverse autotransporter beta domain-containing protein [Klebsiella aerogenes]
MGYKKRIIARLVMILPLFSAVSQASTAGIFSSQGNNTSSDTETRVAHVVAGLGTAWQQEERGDVMAGQAAGVVSGIAGERLEGWMQQFGTARVQLDVDRHGHGDRSTVDWLLPVYQSPDSILFTQFGYRAPEGRRTVNAGVGVRTFAVDWMYGVNAFFDNDYTGHNRRVGLGTEAWRDDLKLSANTYFRNTDWHSSRDFTDYDERPADGWDVRAEGWLPAYPQLGGRLVYEQYRGHEVALIDKDHRQHNPSAVTAGVSYTPIPLVTAGVDYRAGTGGQDEARVYLAFRFQPGGSWHSLTSTDAVRVVRTLAGSRLDLVERNNTIVLDYRQPALITLTLPEVMQGEAGTRLTLRADITSKYDVSRTAWDTTALLAGGGRVVQQTSGYLQVVLPGWQQGGGNRYPVHAIAYDTRGHASNAATTTLLVSEPVVTLTDDDITVVKNNAPADGQSMNEVQAKVTDAEGAPVAGQSVSFSATNGAVVTVMNGVTGADGLATATLTNKISGDSRVTARLVSGGEASITTTFIPSGETSLSRLVVVRDEALANGHASDRVAMMVTRRDGTPQEGLTITLAATNGAALSSSTVTTDARGMAAVSLSSTRAGKSTVTAGFGSGATRHAEVVFVSPAEGARVSLVTIKDNAIKDGRDMDEVEATVRDTDGYPVEGAPVHFAFQNPINQILTPRVITGADGKARERVASKSTPSDRVIASLDNGQQASTLVNFLILNNDFAMEVNHAQANGVDKDVFRVTLTRPDNGQPVQGQLVWFRSNDPIMLSATGAITDETGTATVSMTSTQPSPIGGYGLFVRCDSAFSLTEGGVYFR